MTSPDTKPEKAEASAVEVLRSLEWSLKFQAGPQLRHLCPTCGSTLAEGHTSDCRLAAALQSSSSAEDDLRALLSSAKTTIALLMERATTAEARVKVLEEALKPILSFVEINDTGYDVSPASGQRGPSDRVRQLDR